MTQAKLGINIFSCKFYFSKQFFAQLFLWVSNHYMPMQQYGVPKCKFKWGGKAVQSAVTGGAVTAKGRVASRRKVKTSTSSASKRSNTHRENPNAFDLFEAVPNMMVPHAPMARLCFTHRLPQTGRPCRPP